MTTTWINEFGITLSVDSSGHGHKGKGEGGGQFAKSTSSDASKKKTVTQRVIRGAKIIWNIVNAAPAATRWYVENGGYSPRVAKIAYFVALAGDYAVPGLPTGSAAVIIAATIGKPLAPYRAVKALIDAVRSKFSPKKAESLAMSNQKPSRDAVTAVADALRDAEDRDWFLNVLAVAVEESDGDVVVAVELAKTAVEDAPGAAALSTDANQSTADRSVWYSLVLGECLAESGGDVQAALQAAQYILATQPVPVRLSTDASGHEHRGKGEGGGQFVKSSTSTGLSPDEKRDARGKIVTGKRSKLFGPVRISENELAPNNFLKPNNPQTGEPISLESYHASKSGKVEDHFNKGGLFLSPDLAPEYADDGTGRGRIFHVSIHFKNPIVGLDKENVMESLGMTEVSDYIDDMEKGMIDWDRMAYWDNLISKKVSEEGHDGIILTEPNGVNDMEYIALKKSTISATKELGKFDFKKNSLINTSLSVEAYFAHDIRNPDAQDILNRSLRAVRKMSSAARMDLATALERGDDVGEAILGFIQKYRLHLARVLTATQLASLLRGALEVAEKVPPLGTVPVEGLPVEEQERVASVKPPEPFSIEGPAEDDPERIHFPIIDAAVKNLASRNVLDRAQYEALEAAARAKALTVANVAAEETLTKIRDSLAKNVEEGADYETWRKAVLEDVGEGTFMSDAHQEVVFRTNVQTAFSDGQMSVLSHPLVRSGFPYSAYDSIHDDRRRPKHGALEHHGIGDTNVYRNDDPVFQLFRPPWDYNDRCGWTPLTVRQAAERGIPEAMEWLRTGVEPSQKSHVEMPPFQPPEGFRRSVSGLPLSVQLSLQSMLTFGDIQLGMVGDEYHGPKPPGEGWSAIAPGPRGGKRWKRVSDTGQPQRSQQATSQVAQEQPAKAVKTAKMQKASKAPKQAKAPPKVSAAQQKKDAAQQKKIFKENAVAAIKNIIVDYNNATAEDVRHVGLGIMYMTMPELKVVAQQLGSAIKGTKAVVVDAIINRAKNMADKVMKSSTSAPVPIAKPVASAPTPAPTPQLPPKPLPSPVVLPKSSQDVIPQQSVSAAKKAVLQKMSVGLKNSQLSDAGRTEHEKQTYKIMDRMPEAVHSALSTNLTKISFCDKPADVKKLAMAYTNDYIDSIKGVSKSQKDKAMSSFDQSFGNSASGVCMAGAEVYSDGIGTESRSLVEGGAGKEDWHKTSEGITAHELMHVIDGKNHRHSKSPVWHKAFLDEIANSTGTTPETAKLTKYAGESPSEGFAEFGRLLYGTDTDFDKIKQLFPQCSAYIKSQGLWPNPRKTSAQFSVSENDQPSGEIILPELFNKRIQLLDSKTSHADCMIGEQE